MRQYCRLLSFALLLLLFATPVNAKRRAFLIGISNYEDSNWCKLSSDIDINIISEKLSKEWDIVCLSEQNATYKGITNLLRQIGESQIMRDTILIHFSGHGQQMLPQYDDLSEPDCLDESIVPYDAYLHYSSKYKGQNHLRDNDFSRFIDSIRDKVGTEGLVIITIDACHSDSMQRGHMKSCGIYQDDKTYRGTSEIFGKNITDEDIKKRFNRDLSPIATNGNAPVVYISACQAHSRNQELKLEDGTGCGSLSYAIFLSLSPGEPFDVNIFIKNVISHMKNLVPYQNPSVRKSF